MTMQSILEQQQTAFLKSLPVSASDRIDRLQRAESLLKTHSKALCKAMNADFGQRPVMLSEFVDILSAINALRHARKHVRHWMKDEKRGVRFPLNLLGARAWIQYQPKGVIGILSPWNFPVNLTFSPLADALAAGNRVMIKPSEATPETSALMADLIAAEFDPTEVSVITGDAGVAAEFSSLPFDHLLFTGSTAVGHHVMRAAAENLTPVTLELGGKSPVIIGKQTRMKDAAEKIILGKMMNAGQVCLAPDYILVSEKDMKPLCEELIQAHQRMYTGSNTSDVSTIVSDGHHQRLVSLLDEAREHGTEVIQTGESATESGRDMPLTILINPAEDLKVMQEEIFGPLLPVLTYGSVDEAIETVNSAARPLGLYYFGPDKSEQKRVLDRTISGGVTLDDVIFHVSAEELPFGGVGASGMGAYHGYDGFRTMSHSKSVYRQSRFGLSRLIGLIPPYGKRLRRMIDLEMR